MKLAVFDDFSIGVVEADRIIGVDHAVPAQWRNTPHAILAVIADFGAFHAKLGDVSLGTERSLTDVQLRAPVPAPRTVLAAPLNYLGHNQEMGPGVAPGAAPSPRTLGFFLKATSSICGPSDVIEIPDWPGRTIDYEGELAVVIGRTARDIAPEDALDYVFGFTCALDMTMRMTDHNREERVMRKSFDTFTPLGPWITTKDEVPPLDSLGLRLSQNGALRQDGNTAEMIVGVAELIASASRVMTLSPGDVYLTGTPSGVGAVSDGDTLTLSIDGVGELTMHVRARPSVGGSGSQ